MRFRLELFIRFTTPGLQLLDGTLMDTTWNDCEKLPVIFTTSQQNPKSLRNVRVRTLIDGYRVERLQFVIASRSFLTRLALCQDPKLCRGGRVRM